MGGEGREGGRRGKRGWEERGGDLISKVVKYTNVAFTTDKSVL